jgi:hypothetical protein
MHFEAGAIAKTLRRQRKTASMFTYLHGLGAGELSGPLAQYQATLTTRADTALLVAALAKFSGGDAGDAMNRFQQLWPQLEDAIELVAPQTPVEVLPLLESRFDRKTFREPVADCMSQTWTDRHAGAREVLAQLRVDKPLVEERCRPFHVELFRELIAELDGYAMAMSALLVGREPPFVLGVEGRLEIDAGIAAACESRRERIHTIVAQLMDPDGAPACDESRQFVSASTRDAKRSVLHRKKHEMRGWTTGARIRAGKTDRRDSRWEFDRIVAYVLQLPGDLGELVPRWPARDLLSAADGEINRAYSEGASRPPMALYYALRALAESLDEPDAELKERVMSLVARLDDPEVSKLIQDKDEFRFSELIAVLRRHGSPSPVQAPTEP